MLISLYYSGVSHGIKQHSRNTFVRGLPLMLAVNVENVNDSGVVPQEIMLGDGQM